MARKNLIGVSLDDNRSGEVTAPTTSVRPLAGFVPPAVRNSPIGGISKTLGSITQKVERAENLEKQLSEGQTIIEIDPGLVDGSFISDRIGVDAAELAQLVGQIRDHGQQVPILVRPHPKVKGRYQVAYGHRRLAAVKELAIKVRAVVRDLTDDQLVVSQGQENNARTNLTYIERALFAVRLEDRSFSREVIMSALGVDKAALSKMISIIRQIPTELIEAIGAAPEIGRRRWMECAELLPQGRLDEPLDILSKVDVKALSSDQRFQTVFHALTTKPEKANVNTPVIRTWAPKDRSITINMKDNGKTATIALGAANGSRFAAYLTDRLDELYADWKMKQEN